MSSQGMSGNDKPPGRDPKRPSYRNHERKRKQERKLRKNLNKVDLILLLDVDEVERNPGQSLHHDIERERMSQRRLRKNLIRVNVTPSLDVDDEESTARQQELDQPILKKRKHSELDAGNVDDTIDDGGDNGADGETEVVPQPPRLVFEEAEPWETPPNKKTKYRRTKTRSIHDPRPVSYPTMPIKLTVFFHDHRARVLPPIRQDGTPLNELTDVETIRAMVEKVYAQQFRKTNYDRAAPKEAYHAFMAIKWSEYYVHGCRFSYTDNICTRIQLPLMRTPEEFHTQAQVAAANVTNNHCYCGGMYCRYYNHPVELMVIYVLKEGQNERVEVRWSKEYADRKAAPQQEVLQSIEEGGNEDELAEAAKPKQDEQDDEYEEAGKGESSEEEDEKIVVPSRRRKAAPSAQEEDWEESEEEVSIVPAKPSRRPATTMAGAGGAWDAQVEALKEKVEAGEEDPATIEAIRVALGMEPRRSRRN